MHKFHFSSQGVLFPSYIIPCTSAHQPEKLQVSVQELNLHWSVSTLQVIIRVINNPPDVQTAVSTFSLCAAFRRVHPSIRLFFCGAPVFVQVAGYWLFAKPKFFLCVLRTNLTRETLPFLCAGRFCLPRKELPDSEHPARCYKRHCSPSNMKKNIQSQKKTIIIIIKIHFYTFK